MSDRRSSLHSEASSTLTEFVRRRFDTQLSPTLALRVPQAVDVNNIYNSLTSSFATALSGISMSLQRIEKKAATQARVEKVAANLTDNPPTEQELRDAMTLDDSKIRLLLDVSQVSVDDMQRQFLLLRSAREAIKAKFANKELAKQRHQAAELINHKVSDAEIASTLTPQQSNNIDMFATKIEMVDEVSNSLVKRSCIHDSIFSGRTTNKSLALIGDSALALLLKEKAVERNVDVETLNIWLQATQSNEALKDSAIRIGINKLMVVGPMMDQRSTSGLATMIEAIFGAVYLVGGMDAVRRLNKRHIKICKFDKLFDVIK